MDAPRERPEPIAACVERATALADERDAAVARALCAEQRTHRVPGVVVAIAEHGAIAFRFAHGTRCDGRPEPVSEATAFRIGSLTKAITAAAAFAIAERGELVLDAPIGKAALAELGLADGLADVSMRQLLDHRAGLPDILPDATLRDRSRAEQLTALIGTPIHPAGSTWHYANGGYALAGALLGASAHAPWHAVVAREVFAPLAMTSARALPDPQGDVACGHLPAGAGWASFDVREDFDRFAFGVDATAPSGAVIATADDLLRFALALSRTPAERPPWTTRMLDAVTTTATPTGRRTGERYAAGLQVTESRGELVLRHAGNTGDFSAELVWVPERGVAAVVLGNAGVPLAATMAAALVRIGVDPRRESG